MTFLDLPGPSTLRVKTATAPTLRLLKVLCALKLIKEFTKQYVGSKFVLPGSGLSVGETMVNFE